MSDTQSEPTSGQTLTPEQREAIEVFVSTLPMWRNYYVEQLPTTIFENNARFFTPVQLKKDNFPREAHWTWNRSNGSVVIDLHNQFRIKLSKYNSRRRKNCPQQQPSYKIWSYSVTVLTTKEQFAFIWCTKGKTRAPRSTVSKTPAKVPKVSSPAPVPIPSPAPSATLPSNAPSTTAPLSYPTSFPPTHTPPQPAAVGSSSRPPPGFMAPPMRYQSEYGRTQHANEGSSFVSPPLMHRPPHEVPYSSAPISTWNYSHHPRVGGYTPNTESYNDGYNYSYNSYSSLPPQRSSYPQPYAPVPVPSPQSTPFLSRSHSSMTRSCLTEHEFSYEYRFDTPQEFSFTSQLPEYHSMPLADDLEQLISFDGSVGFSPPNDT